MSSPKTTRTPPLRVFENYTLTRVTDSNVGLANVPDSIMSSTLGGNVDDSVSGMLPIGFDFSIDGVTYNRFIVCVNGWMALVGPTETDVNTVTTSLIHAASGTFKNEGINLENSSSNVLIAPWFDNLRTVANDLISLPYTVSGDKRSRIRNGLEAPPLWYNNVESGVKVFTENNTSEGRRTIVRWSALSDWSNASTAIRFDAVLYENGKIEFRYAPRQNLTLVETKYSSAADAYIEDATIGIFMSGSNRFRDFSFGLGIGDTNRRMYTLGGAVYDPSFQNGGFDDAAAQYVNRPYVWRLRPATHWPGIDKEGGMFVFSPPTLRKKILPRLEIRERDSDPSFPTIARTGDQRRGNRSVRYDDRNSINFITSTTGSNGQLTGTVVNMPTTLPRFYGDSGRGASSRQALFSNGLELTGSIVKGSAEQFLRFKQPVQQDPWSETNLYALASGAYDDEFFSGSSIDEFGLNLSYPLKSKTNIRFSMPVNYNVSMLQYSSSMYYYNRARACWTVPKNATYVSDLISAAVPAGTTKGDISDPNIWPAFNSINEDYRGFGPLGNCVVSGTHTPAAATEQTDPMIGADYTAINNAIALTKEYNNSVQINDDYSATDDELFTVPINNDFILEKAIIEVPMAFGDGWFSDKTTCFRPIESSSSEPFDIGGPAITVALYNQYVVGNRTRRDLILTGTITHRGDDSSNIVISNFPSYTTIYQIRPQGFRAFGSVPSVVIDPVTNGSGQNVYTGSVPVKCVAQVSNGLIVNLTRYMTKVTTAFNRSGTLELFNAERLALKQESATHYTQTARIASINPYGRSMTGFDPSGRSVFGKEHTSYQTEFKNGSVQNPFYLSGGMGNITFENIEGLGRSGAIPQQFVDVVISGTYFVAPAAIPLESCKPSPYLLRPGDKLVLAVAKTRPFVYGNQTSGPSGSIVHDVQFITGAINVSLYGSMLKEDKETHETLNQQLVSDAIHETIGMEPITDQFENSSRAQYVNGIYDDYVTGSMVTSVVINNVKTLVTGNFYKSGTSSYVSNGIRAKAFSKYDARSQAADSNGGVIASLNPSYAQRLQPWYEKVGTVRTSQHIAQSERYWDSLMPSISECFNANGAGIFTVKSGSALFRLSDGDKVDSNVGYIWFDYSAQPIAGNWPNQVDSTWNWSFPFEPRYSGIARQRFIEKSFISKYEIDIANSIVRTTPPRQLSGLLFGSVGTELPGVPPTQSTLIANHNVAQAGGQYAGYDFHWVCDAYLNSTTPAGYVLTSSAGVNDVVKCLFGFGDLNVRVKTVSSGTGGDTYFGATHMADFHHRVADSFFLDNHWSFSPIIRGWRYGVYSGLPSYTKAYFRQGRYGQLRDMLEQRPFTKFYDEDTSNGRSGVQLTSAVTVKFVNKDGSIAVPENTDSQNLSLEATSSVPYFDGETRNRPDINRLTQNSSVIAINHDVFGQLVI